MGAGGSSLLGVPGPDGVLFPDSVEGWRGGSTGGRWGGAAGPAVDEDGPLGPSLFRLEADPDLEASLRLWDELEPLPPDMAGAAVAASTRLPVDSDTGSSAGLPALPPAKMSEKPALPLPLLSS